MFLCVCSTSLLKTLLEKEKLLIMSNFSFSHSVFYPFRDFPSFSSNSKLSSANSLSLEESKICFWKKVKKVLVLFYTSKCLKDHNFLFAKPYALANKKLGYFQKFTKSWRKTQRMFLRMEDEYRPKNHTTKPSNLNPTQSFYAIYLAEEVNLGRINCTKVWLGTKI